MAWFCFDQNNSGGSFTVNEKLTHRIFIEADTSDDAENTAFEMGVYYNGCSDGIDCDCCGDRWYGFDEIKFPHYSGATDILGVANYFANNYGWCEPDARLFYSSGDVVEIFTEERK